MASHHNVYIFSHKAQVLLVGENFLTEKFRMGASALQEPKRTEF
jgi:hypothetical protein